MIRKLLNLSHFGFAKLNPIEARETLMQQRSLLQDLVKRRFIYWQSFEIHGGSSGLYDYGPVGCSIKNNIQQLWRQHFVLEQDMLEIRATCLTPSPVLEASGHVAKFSDLLVKDTMTHACYRADKLLIENIEQKLKKASQSEVAALNQLIVEADSLSKQQLAQVFKSLKIVAPQTGNPLSSPQPFNLMFKTSIGPNSGHIGYLRPQTAQGIFVNFSKLLEYNNGRMPFASAQIGLGFRNEISPRSGLLRVREFQMAQIEHFVDPSDKSHSKFSKVRDVFLPLVRSGSKDQDIEWLNVGKAVNERIVLHETLAYFLVRSYQFLTSLGIHPDLIRIRQLSNTQRAHYAQDCWDIQIMTSYGWIECISCADRGSYDLQSHSNSTNQKLYATRKLKASKVVHELSVELDKAAIAKRYKSEAAIIFKTIQDMSQQQLAKLRKQLDVCQQVTVNSFKIEKYWLNFQDQTINKSEQKYIPHVVEPSFGLGRIMYCMLQHSFKIRDKKRTYMSLNSRVAPYKISLLPLSSQDSFAPLLNTLQQQLRALNVTYKIDDSSQSIGKRYARTDQIGIPYGFTLDFDSLQGKGVTLRQLDSTSQVRIPLQQAAMVADRLSRQQTSWKKVSQQYPKYQ